MSKSQLSPRDDGGIAARELSVAGESQSHAKGGGRSPRETPMPISFTASTHDENRMESDEQDERC
jgi:hypothetical protein